MFSIVLYFRKKAIQQKGNLYYLGKGLFCFVFKPFSLQPKKAFKPSICSGHTHPSTEISLTFVQKKAWVIIV